MASFSLIVPLGREEVATHASVQEARGFLEGQGHQIEVVTTSGSEVDINDASDAGGIEIVDPQVEAGEQAVTLGRTASVLRALEKCRSDYLLVFDPRSGFEPAAVLEVARALESGAGELIIASRWTALPGSGVAGHLKSYLGKLLTALTGTSDPLSPLIGLSRKALESASPEARPIGNQFTLELLARVRGHRKEIGARVGNRNVPPRKLHERIQDLKLLKRVIDYRFGMFSRLVQFCMVGASGMVVDLSLYALFQGLFKGSALAERKAPFLGRLDLAVAAILAVTFALTWNFILNRRLTFNDARSGSLTRQYIAYAVSNALAISVNLGIRLKLPQHVPYFSRHTLTAAVVGIVVATAISFSMARWFVFRRPSQGRPIPPRESVGAHQCTRLEGSAAL